MAIVRYLLGQQAFQESLVYAPVVERNESDERMYGEIHTEDWWWETQNTLPERSTVVPIIFASDGIHLTNFSGDKKAWPIHLTIGNIKSCVQSKPTGHSLILLGLLPVLPKLGKNSLANSALRRQSQMALHRALGEIFQSIRECFQEGELIACADGCEVEFHSLGSTRRSPTGDYEDYRERVKLFRENSGNLGLVEYLVARSVKTLFNAFWGMPRVNPYDVNKLDILHNIYLGMLKHMMEWFQAFLKNHNQLTTVKGVRDRTKTLNASGSQNAQRGLEEIREIRERSHFNFIKLHVLTHYREHVERFESIPPYSTDISELAHVRQIKEAYGASNKVDAAKQILDYRGRRLALAIRMLNLKDIVGGPESTDDILWSHRDNLKQLLEIFKIEGRKKTPNERSIVEGRLPLRRLCNPSTKSERLFNIVDGLQISHTALNRLIKEYAEDAGCSQSFAGSSESILERRVEMFKCLQVPIPIFQRPEVYKVHNIRCTGNATFRKGKIRKDWVWVSVASSEEWGVFRGRLPVHVEALFKLRDSEGRAHRLCIVELLEAKDRGIANSLHGLLKVCRRRRKRVWIVNIRSILEMGHLFEVETGN
ncbi:uncharacterized protein H6S33_004910 [Morchella sextelata]|uniref:uncharacterized protein n=1 Tax=Morchella sextelata TaxID=1174677 RepID=UPI001D045056|nr:uncharacterized protein H6S33_004910 [Morchella sextelata]KAH0605688.1 hypothetical protein H6S33_004910 [Morchella sextelata]